jgi:hypothetical protein
MFGVISVQWRKIAEISELFSCMLEQNLSIVVSYIYTIINHQSNFRCCEISCEDVAIS